MKPVQHRPSLLSLDDPDVRLITTDDCSELGDFGRRNREYHGDDFEVPCGAEGWRQIALDATQRWYRLDVVGLGLVGVMCLVRWSGPPWCTADLGAGADENAAGRGILAAGLRRLLDLELMSGNFERVEALIRPSNVASERFVTAAGFRLEGLARSALHRRGQRLDMNRYAIVRSDCLPNGS